MIAENPSQNGRPPQVAAAFWGQLAVAGLLVVLVVVNAAGQLLVGSAFLRSRELVFCGLLLGLAGWLVAAALGLRRRSRTAYAWSLAGLVLPLLLAVAGLLGAGTTYHQTLGSVPAGGRDVFAVAERLAVGMPLSYAVNGFAVIIGPLLVVATVGLLATGACRRFFIRPNDFR